MPRRVNAFRSTPQYRTFVGGAGTLGLQTDALSHSQSVFQTLEEGRGKVIESELFERGTSLRNKAIAHLLATSINYYPMSVAASQTASHSARSVPASRMARRSGWRAEHDQNCGVGLDPDRRRSRSRLGNCRAQYCRDPPAKDRGPASSRAEGDRRQEAGGQVVGRFRAIGVPAPRPFSSIDRKSRYTGRYMKGEAKARQCRGSSVIDHGSRDETGAD